MNEAELLFSRILGLSRAEMCLRMRQPLGREVSLRIAAVLRRRGRGEPLPYILGSVEFMGLDFKVGPTVLIPRQETELLVEEALALIRRIGRFDLRVLDLCTGSGCIAVSVAKLSRVAQVDASDISDGALEVARLNARRHKAGVNFIKADLFEGCLFEEGVYDLILSNPPYVAGADIEHLAPEVRQEPRLALEAGREGLDFYSRIAKKAAAYLKEGGYLMLEMGFGQRGAVEDIFEEAGFRAVKFIRDYQGIDRVIILQRKAG
ncbi:MAG: peptide chain release factor N(5)-glutamine methyltransferase [Candidatus Omnitrophota bacterium]